jgi:predicted RNA-binding protein Jag
VTKKEAKKILQYKDLITEIQRVWNVKAKVIQVIIGANGTILKSLRQYLSNMSVIPEIKELQTKAILGSANILCKVLK